MDYKDCDMTNTVKNPFGNVSPEQMDAIMDKVLGNYTNRPLPDDEAILLWESVLWGKVPEKVAGSLHVHEEVYTHDGKRYSCKWALSGRTKVPSIDELIPRVRYVAPPLTPRQAQIRDLLHAIVPEMDGMQIDFDSRNHLELFSKLAGEIVLDHNKESK
jgi:hypothetical protein